MSIAYNLQKWSFGLLRKDYFDDRGVDYNILKNRL